MPNRAKADLGHTFDSQEVLRKVPGNQLHHFLEPQDEIGWTPLMVAANKGHTAAVQEVSVDCVNNKCHHAAAVSCRLSRPDVRNNTVLIEACHVAVLQVHTACYCLQLLRAGAQVHHISKDNRSTALHEAVLRSHVRYLILA